MTTVAEAPASGEINREGALMVAAVNGTIRPQSFPALHHIDQVAGRNEMNDVSPSRQTLGDGHLPTSSQAERRCLPSWNFDKVCCCGTWYKRTLCSSQFLRTPSCLKMMVISGIMLVDLTFLVE